MRINPEYKSRLCEWRVIFRDKIGLPNVKLVKAWDFAQAASDAYFIKNNLNSMNDEGWKIESITMVTVDEREKCFGK